MIKHFDYAGNEINEGQEIFIVTTIKRTPQWGYFVPSRDTNFISEKVPDEECWELSAPIKLDFNLGFWVEGKSCKTYNTLDILKAYMLDDSNLIAIKGISDTKEYYDLWKQKQNKK